MTQCSPSKGSVQFLLRVRFPIAHFFDPATPFCILESPSISIALFRVVPQYKILVISFLFIFIYVCLYYYFSRSRWWLDLSLFLSSILFSFFLFLFPPLIIVHCVTESLQIINFPLKNLWNIDTVLNMPFVLLLIDVLFPLFNSPYCHF